MIQRKYIAFLMFIAKWYTEPAGMSVKLKCNLGTIVLEMYRIVLMNLYGKSHLIC